MIVGALIDFFLESIFLFPGRCLLFILYPGKRKIIPSKKVSGKPEKPERELVVASLLFWVVLIVLVVVLQNR